MREGSFTYMQKIYKNATMLNEPQSEFEDNDFKLFKPRTSILFILHNRALKKNHCNRITEDFSVFVFFTWRNYMFYILSLLSHIQHNVLTNDILAKMLQEKLLSNLWNQPVKIEIYFISIQRNVSILSVLSDFNAYLKTNILKVK